jgi:hypothetical protein
MDIASFSLIIGLVILADPFVLCLTHHVINKNHSVLSLSLWREQLEISIICARGHELPILGQVH